MRQRALFVPQKIDTQVHFQPRESLILARLQALAVDLWVVGFGRVRVAANLVAKLAAEHLVNRHSISLACQIPERHFDAADAAGLPGVTAELLDFSKDLIDVTRVFTQNAALEDQGVGLAGAVANFAQPVYALISIDANQRARKGRAGNHGDAQVGDLEIRRVGVSVHVLRRGIEGLVSPETSTQRSRGGADEATPADTAKRFHGHHFIPIVAPVIFWTVTASEPKDVKETST